MGGDDVWFVVWGCRDNRLTSVCCSSAIHGCRLLSFACPKESNQRKGHPRGRGLPASLPANFASRLRGLLTVRPCTAANSPASCGRPRAEHAAIPAPARRGREGPGKSRARQSLPQKRFVPLRSGEGRTDQPRAPHAGGARDRADSDDRPGMACWPNPFARSEPSPKARARIRGCRFLWLLSFGQAKESNRRPWMVDEKHMDVSRLSHQTTRKETAQGST